MFSEIYLLTFLIIWWSYSGYTLSLYLIGKIKSHDESAKKKEQSSISVIVPAFNEETVIAQKIDNLLQISYPKELLEILIVDDGSTDNTVKIAREYISKNPQISLLASQKQRGKINCINTGLRKAKGDIVVVSDADGIISPQGVNSIAELLQQENVGAVGLCTLPLEENSLPEELRYWEFNNKTRFLESWADSTHCLNAPCYGFKKELLPEFPEDVIADDFYTVLKVREQGYRAIYTPDAAVYEIRTPDNFKKLAKQKFRKSGAYLREFFRFGLKPLDSSVFGAVIYPTKLIQFFVAPFTTILFGVITVYLLYSGELLMPLVYIGFLALGTIVNSWMLSRVSHPPIKKDLKKAFPGWQVYMFILITAILAFSVLVYPLSQGTSKYKRI